MWVKATNGTLVNMAHVSHINVREDTMHRTGAPFIAVANINSGVQGAVCVLYEGQEAWVRDSVEQLYRELRKESQWPVLQ